MPCAAAEFSAIARYLAQAPARKATATMRRIWGFIFEVDGPTAVEYAVLLAGIIALCIGGITLVGGGTQNFWNNNRTQLDNALGSGS